MRTNSAVPACLALLAAGLTWAQKPTTDASKTDHSPAAPHSASPAPSPQPTHSKTSQTTGHPSVDPEANSKAPRANPIKPVRIESAKIEEPQKIRKMKPVAGSATAPSNAQTLGLILPIVDWPSPMPIRQGQPLAEALLGASADVPGTFIYSPMLSYVPPQGQSMVTIQFQPAEPARYQSASATVWVTVQ